MELSEGDRATKAINTLVETLEGLPHVTVSHVEAEPGFGRHLYLDAAVEVDVAGKGIVLIVAVLEIEGNDIRGIVGQKYGFVTARVGEKRGTARAPERLGLAAAVAVVLAAPATRTGLPATRAAVTGAA